MSFLCAENIDGLLGHSKASSQAKPTGKKPRRRREKAGDRRVRKSREPDANLDRSLKKSTRALLLSAVVPDADATDSASDGALAAYGLKVNHERSAAFSAQVAPGVVRKNGNSVTSDMKRYLKVDKGATMRALEKEEREKMVAQGKANTQLMRHNASLSADRRYRTQRRNRKRQWREHIDDGKLDRQLQQDAEAGDVLAQATAQKFREHKRHLQLLGTPEKRRQERVDVLAGAEAPRALVETAPINFRQPLTRRESGELNILDEPMSLLAETPGEWARKYTAVRAQTADEASQRFEEWLRRDIVKTIEAQYQAQLIAVAGSASVYGGEKPTTLADTATDYLRRLRKAKDPALEVDEDTFMRILTLANETHEETPEDMVDATAAKFVEWEEKQERALLARPGAAMTRAEIDMQLSYQVAPQEHMLLKHAIDAYGTGESDWAALDDAARAETKLSERIRKHERQHTRRVRKEGIDLESVSQLALSDTPVMADDETGVPLASKPRHCHVEQMFPKKSLHAKEAKLLEEIDHHYAQEFMRKGRGAEFCERPCVNNEACVCNTMAVKFPDPADARSKSAGFVCREFLLPSEIMQYRESGKLPKRRKMCILCNRYKTTDLVSRNVQSGNEPVAILQDHFYKIDSLGGYNCELCISAVCNRQFTGIVAPFVHMSENNYHYKHIDVGGQMLPCYEEYELMHFREVSGTTII